MNEKRVKLCLLTPEQEQQIKEENTKYTAHDRETLGLLVNGIYDLVRILELYTLDQQNDITDHLTSFQILKHLIEPVQEYFGHTSGVSLENSPVE
jgi:hypothetical protein